MAPAGALRPTCLRRHFMPHFASQWGGEGMVEGGVANAVVRSNGDAEFIRKIEAGLRKVVESWTRFDSRELAVDNTVPGLAKARISRVFQVVFSSATTCSPGRGRIGVNCGSREGFDRHVVGDMLAMQANLPRVLHAWDLSNRSSLVPVLTSALVVEGGKPAFHNIQCVACGARGRVDCLHCSGVGRRSCSSCVGGYNRCRSCDGSGQRTVTCSGCHGNGTRYESVQYQAWDHARGQAITEYRTECVTCSACRGMPRRTEPCYACSQTGKTTCSACSGSMQVSCSGCGATGKVTCESCTGLGYDHEQYVPTARVMEEWTREPPESEGERAVWAIVGHDLEGFVGEWSWEPGNPTASGICLTRDVVVPFATASVGLNDDMRSVLGVGPDLALQRLDGLGDLILDNDAADLEAMTASPGDAGAPTIDRFFASEIHRRTALLLDQTETAGERAKASDAMKALAAETNGFMTPAYIERAKSAIANVIASELRRRHWKAMHIAVAAAAVALIGAWLSSRFYPVPGRWAWVLIAVSGVFIWSEIHLRHRSLLSAMASGNRKLISLRRAYARERFWLLGYLLLGITGTAGYFQLEPITPELGASTDSVTATEDASERLPVDVAVGPIARQGSIAQDCKPSFRCDVALNRIEKLICQERSLCQLDNSLARTYDDRRSSMSPAAQHVLRQDQRAWLKNSRSACSDAQCLEAVYLQRIAELSD